MPEEMTFTSNRKEQVLFGLKTFFLFFFLYDVVFMGVPTHFSTRKISFVAFFVWFVILFFFSPKKKYIFTNRLTLGLYGALAAVTALSVPYTMYRANFYGVLGTEGVEYPQAIYFILYCLVAPIMVAGVFEGRREFEKSIAITAALQSLFLLVEYKLMPFKEFLNRVIDNSNSNISYLKTTRATGLGASGSMVSLVLAFCVFIMGLRIVRREDDNPLWPWWCVIGLCFVAEFCSGKTGFYLSIVNILILLVVYLLGSAYPGRTLRNMVLILGGLGLAFGLWYGFYGKNVYLIKEKFRHVFNLTVEFGSSKYSFWTKFNEGDVPPINMEVLFGLGIFKGTTNTGLHISHDGGYIRRFVAEGAIFSVLEYALLLVLLLVLLFQMENLKTRLYLMVLTAALFFVELKEPYIYKYTFVFLLLAAIFLDTMEIFEGERITAGVKKKVGSERVHRNLFVKKTKRALKYHALISENAKKIEELMAGELRNLHGKFINISEREIWKNAFLEFNKYKPEEAVTICEHYVAENIRQIKKSYDPVRIPQDEPILLCNVRDDISRIKNLIEHHRKMGIKYFAILDNGSKDGTLEYLKGEHIDLYTVKEQYTSVVRAAWMIKIAANYGFDRWYVVIDSDELLEYPGGKKGDIKEIIDDLKKKGISRGRGMMVDMYAEKSSLSATAEDRIDPGKYRYFDTDSYESREGIFAPEVFGGPRERMFGSRDDVSRELLTKYPVFFWKRGEIYRYHYLFPFEENFKSPCVLALKHYKFADGDLAKMQRIVSEGNYAGGSALYGKYVDKIPESGEITFMTAESKEFTAPSDLLEVSVMENLNE